MFLTKLRKALAKVASGASDEGIQDLEVALKEAAAAGDHLSYGVLALSAAAVWEGKSDYNRAVLLCEEALKARPDFPAALLALARLFVKSGDRERAVAAIERCRRAFAPGDDEILSAISALESRVTAGQDANPKNAKAKRLRVKRRKKRPS